VQWDGETYVPVGSATFDTISTADDTAKAGTDIVLDNIGGGYVSAAALQTALTTKFVGNIDLPGSGIADGTVVDMLIAYQNSTTKEIDIADVNIINPVGNGVVHDTAAAGITLTVTNLIGITTSGLVGVADLGTNPIFFMHH
jgi:hypothetical protein